ncbi:MAG TPA: sulfotransferase [candidate division Zixibacteria bacterium]|nr:sulfotransferase [candidate division Zixibacteria bacterium]
MVLEPVRAALRRTPVHVAWRFGVATIGARREAGALAGVETYCLFIGHPRSGHSIVGALLDAHPEMTVSDELDALRYVSAGFTRDQVLYLSVRTARHQAAHQRRKLGRGGTYSYHVPGQWQGRFRRLRVVGDSRAGWTVRRLSSDPALLRRLEQRMRPLELRFIHVVRNPFDNISTMVIRGGRTLEDAIARYFANCRSLVDLRTAIGAERLLTMRHEDLIADPRRQLTDACRLLGVSPTDEYLDACAGVLYARPSRSRSEVDWPEGARRRVARLIDEYEFLRAYSFDE